MNPSADYVPLINLPVEWEWTLMKTGQVLAIMVLLLISLAFLLLFDRKIWAAVQLRKGPNVVGPFGLLQLAADDWPALARLPLFVPSPRVAEQARAAGAQIVVDCRGASAAALQAALEQFPAAAL